MSTALTLSFAEISAADLPTVGGKGANLGEMTRHGFAVPPGFCVTTEAFTRFMEGSGAGDRIHAALDALDPNDVEGAARAGSVVRGLLLAAPVPDDVAQAVLAAFRAAGVDRPYAVRSSATAEDLPDASFAGQQDTYLNVRGEAALLDAVRACWASLFTDRAILYRAKNGFSHRDVRLSVVVQQMVFPDVSGILFTVDPVTGHRGVLSIDASYGLGEALVSGLVSADLYRVDKRDRHVIERRIGDKRLAIRPAPRGGTVREEVPEALRAQPALTGADIEALTDLGVRIEAHYGMPMDIEWGIEGGRLYVLQARPVTSLFPLPSPPPEDGLLHVYMSFSHAQVMTDPMTPMGRSVWRMLFPFGKPNGSQVPNPFLTAAGGRLYVDLSPLLRHPMGRRMLLALLPNADRLIAGAVSDIVARGDLDGAVDRAARASLPGVARWVVPLILKAQAMLWIQRPEAVAPRVSARIDHTIAAARTRIEAASPGAARLREARAILDATMFDALLRIAPCVGAGFMAKTLLERITRDRADPEDLAALWRGLSGNVTTEMDLAVGDLADQARGCDALAAAIAAGADTAAALAAARGAPDGAAFLKAWDDFLDRYGMRGPSEIDISRPRYRDEPAALLQLIAAGVQHGQPGAHRAHHARMRAAGEAAASRLIALAREGRFGRGRAVIVRRLVRAARALLPLREHPKFMLIQMMVPIRAALLEAGRILVESGRADAPDDMWFLDLDEAIQALEDPRVDVRARVRQRREEHARFRNVRPPRVITSEGEIPEVHYASTNVPDGAMPGTGVSAGVIEGVARVVMDPAKDQLRPGEILVAPFTDPGWTPLFIHAAGLVMEVGGMMTHGSVVAREYGIPAVVGVLNATRTIRTGQRIRVHGDGGYVQILPEAQPFAN